MSQRGSARGAEGHPATGHVFISYVRENALEVERLQRALEQAGIRVWRDTADLWPGEDWRAKIREAITDNALVFVACFSHKSAAREKSYQNEELLLAIEQLRIRQPDDPWLIPIRFDDCEIPNRDIGGGRTLSSIQRADLFGDSYEEGAERLVAAVIRILERRSSNLTPAVPSGTAVSESRTSVSLERTPRIRQAARQVPSEVAQRLEELSSRHSREQKVEGSHTGTTGGSYSTPIGVSYTQAGPKGFDAYLSFSYPIQGKTFELATMLLAHGLKVSAHFPSDILVRAWDFLLEEEPTDWTHIRSAIDRSHVFCLCISEVGPAEDQVRELEIYRQDGSGRRPIIPVLLSKSDYGKSFDESCLPEDARAVPLLDLTAGISKPGASRLAEMIKDIARR